MEKALKGVRVFTVLIALISVLLGSSSFAQEFPVWTTTHRYENASTDSAIIVVKDEYSSPAIAKQRLDFETDDMRAILGSGVVELELSDAITERCRLFSGRFAEFGGVERDAWASYCYVESDMFIVVSDEDEQFALALATSIVESDSPQIPEDYDLLPAPDDYPGSRTTRGPRLAEERPEFAAGEWYLVSDTGDYLEVRIDKSPDTAWAMGVIRDYDPAEISLDKGASFLSEDDNPVRGCRQFTYESGDSVIYSVICANGDWNLYVFGTDADAVEFVAHGFSEEDTQDFTPDGYSERD